MLNNFNKSQKAKLRNYNAIVTSELSEFNCLVVELSSGSPNSLGALAQVIVPIIKTSTELRVEALAFVNHDGGIPDVPPLELVSGSGLVLHATASEKFDAAPLNQN